MLYMLSVAAVNNYNSPTYCYINQGIKCDGIFAYTNSTYTQIGIIFANNLTNPIYISKNFSFELSPTPTGTYNHGYCNTTNNSIIQPKSTVVCFVNLNGFIINSEIRMQPSFRIEYIECSSAMCSNLSNLIVTTVRGNGTIYVTPGA